uniref:Pco078108b n=1 Tax=Arundo donax TaxID=35708 RepID=A0A0A9DY94_ARUDO
MLKQNGNMSCRKDEAPTQGMVIVSLQGHLRSTHQLNVTKGNKGL